jgi:hypothetical protein
MIKIAVSEHITRNRKHRMPRHGTKTSTRVAQLLVCPDPIVHSFARPFDLFFFRKLGCPEGEFVEKFVVESAVVLRLAEN